ncbi:phosphoenolpyruvate--protein phosphotransferase [Keratinibaculum paraultunense]|uniref:Phosphoenolpyruvate-protein phosphotransferase n=1 Tax=Keratinibaculum paraultunense TaxID=1278232 RepID=A0A4R3KPL1_9FIRM|nr:phosphoenolpyruvate--protein phosphotransferase [Keratinibaculum paraultunense]QQY79349.1 phosphoenolpyruvate--protein phosphotransferase [Keratinibaculum paraultunense]TCS86632.1 phosphoenolpyruvate--protein phosphotransferase [Keratinibaculum paraultunense]
MKGIGTSPGIALGNVLVYKEPEMVIEKKQVADVDEEIERLDKAIEIAIEQIEQLYEKTLETVGLKEAKIFNAHKMMMEDPEFIGDVKETIKSQGVNAEWAVKTIADKYIKMFENIEDEYLRERAVDLKDVSNRLLKILLGIESIDLSTLNDEYIIVAEDLTPSDTAQMDKEMVLGFITEIGGKTSHTSIMARTLEIPAISGVKGITNKTKNGDFVIIDGKEGLVLLNPSQEEIKTYKEKKERYEQFKLKLEDMKGKKSISKDGVKVEIAANIGTPKDVDNVIENDAEGIGLYRTEFLYMDSDKLPTEEEQFEAYKIVAERMEGKPVVIRTLDVGGDKDIPYLDLPKEMNPFLGYRAIRLCLDRKDMFKTQLRALLRASAFGNVKIMFPMISSIEEIRKAKKILEEAKEELRNKNIPFNEEIEVGIMVEIPAAAIHSDIFAKEVDFFSIGTNDLIQYTLAVDRGNQDISYLYNQYHPAVLKLIDMTIKNGHKEGIWVGMCGEAAGDEKLIPILLGMGLDEFSMSSSSILKARWIINNTSKEEIESMLDEVLSLPTAKDVEKFIDENILA